MVRSGFSSEASNDILNSRASLAFDCFHVFQYRAQREVQVDGWDYVALVRPNALNQQVNFSRDESDESLDAHVFANDLYLEFSSIAASTETDRQEQVR